MLKEIFELVGHKITSMQTEWSSASGSPEVGLEPHNVLVDADPAMQAMQMAVAAVSSSTANRFKSCGFLCQSFNGKICRKMVEKHSRGLVCPVCMFKHTYAQCARGCSAYIHVTCQDTTSNVPWLCNSCVTDEVISPVTAAIESLTERFDIEDECSKILHQRGFTVRNTHRNTKGEMYSRQWECKICTVQFTAKLCWETSNWLAHAACHQVCTIYPALNPPLISTRGCTLMPAPLPPEIMLKKDSSREKS